MLFKKFLNGRRITALILLALFAFLPSCTTYKDTLYLKGDRVSMVSFSEGKWSLGLNPDGGFSGKWSNNLTIIMMGEGERIKTGQDEGIKFVRFNTVQDNLTSLNNALKTGYVILYEKDKIIKVSVETDVNAEGFNGRNKITENSILLDETDVPIVNDFFKASASERLSMIKNATGSIKGIPLRDILISCYLRVSSDFTSNRNPEKFVAMLYLPRDGDPEFCGIQNYKNDCPIVETLEQALKQGRYWP